MWSTHMHNIKSIYHKTKQVQPGNKPAIKKAIFWPWGQSPKSPNMVRHTLSWGDLPTYLISKAFLIRQTSCNTDTNLSLKKTIIWGQIQDQRSPTIACDTSPWGVLHTCLILTAYLVRQTSCNPDTNMSLKKQWFDVEVKVKGHRSPTMVRVTLPWGDLPACLISKAYLIRQKRYNPDTKLSLKKQ